MKIWLIRGGQGDDLYYESIAKPNIDKGESWSRAIDRILKLKWKKQKGYADAVWRREWIVIRKTLRKSSYKVVKWCSL